LAMTEPSRIAEQRPGPVEEPALVHRVELMVSYLLRAGVVVSMTLIVLGMCLTFVHHPDYSSVPLPLRDVPKVAKNFPHTVADTLQALEQMRGQGFVLLGLLVLLITPVMRVAISIVAFAIQKDRIFTLITIIVLAILLLSFVLGKTEV
jgi:uncharacterized membrane protein